MTKKTYPAKIDWCSPPGEMLADYLEDRHKIPQDLAHFMGVSENFVNRLITSDEVMTLEMAEKITEFFQMPTYFWTNLVTKYEEFQAKKRNKEVISQKLQSFPYQELLNLGLEKEAEKIRKIAEKILKNPKIAL